MAKRRNVVDDDSGDEAVASSQNSKRARTDDNVDADESFTQRQSQSHSNSTPADNDEEAQSQDEDVEDAEEDDSERQFEEKYYNKVQASIESKKSVSGVCEKGYIVYTVADTQIQARCSARNNTEARDASVHVS